VVTGKALNTKAGLEEPDETPDTSGEDTGLIEDVHTLLADARRFAEAELAYQKARAAYAGQAARTIAILGVVAATLVFFAAMAAVLGSVIALAAVMSPWTAMATVTLVLVVLAVTCVLIALAKVRRMKSVLADGDGDAERS
jgi:uncharacterized membrane protein YqjE